MQLVSVSEPRVTLVQDILAALALVLTTSGNTIRALIPGHRKPTLAEQLETVQLVSASAPRVISVPDMMAAIKMISGNMLRVLIPGHKKPPLPTQRSMQLVLASAPRVI